ncbi:MAG: hypothetical protein HY226_05625 [Candidatus Vogelbacteria bacterium]|nr:hypothetical protein [Candidatus Vogelbacteria bacterium]
MVNQTTGGNKTEFLTGLRSQITALKSDFEGIGNDVKSAQEEGRVASASRQTAVTNLATALLPDLNPERLNALKKVFAFAPSAADANQLRENEKNLLDKEQARVCSGFNPSTYETDVATLDTQIGVHDAKQTEINEILSATPDLERLYKARYGTSNYALWFLSFDIVQYCKDWGRGDNILEALKMKSWGDITAYVKDLDDQRTDAIRESQALRVTKAQLEKARDAYLDIEKRRQETESVVLEKLQIELRAALDSFDGATPSNASAEIARALDSIRSLADKANAAGNRVRTELQPARQSLTAEIGKLETLYAAAEKSRAQNIPTNFIGMTKNAQSRVRNYSGGGSGTVRVEHHYHNDGMDFTTFLMYDALLSHLNTSAPAPVYVERTRTPEYQQPAPTDYDRYGRVS